MDDFDRLNPQKGSKSFWKSCKPYFSNKHSFGKSKIALGIIQKCSHHRRGRGYPKLMTKSDIGGGGTCKL